MEPKNQLTKQGSSHKLGDYLRLSLPTASHSYSNSCPKSRGGCPTDTLPDPVGTKRVYNIHNSMSSLFNIVLSSAAPYAWTLYLSELQLLAHIAIKQTDLPIKEEIPFHNKGGHWQEVHGGRGDCPGDRGDPLPSSIPTS